MINAEVKQMCNYFVIIFYAIIIVPALVGLVVLAKDFFDKDKDKPIFEPYPSDEELKRERFRKEIDRKLKDALDDAEYWAKKSQYYAEIGMSDFEYRLMMKRIENDLNNDLTQRI